ncbi:MAG: alpha/beta hydrolase [Burkholderiales bacterium]|nr:alpha/beta hydrolase [Burkholderiales bacterium]
MPYAPARDARLYYEEAGSGTAIVFVHEFSGDFRSWEAQVRFFSRRYRCVAFNARGYPPSEVPPAPAQYSHVQAAADIGAVMRHLRIAKAHVIGCSMGAYASLMFGMRHPGKAISLTTVGAGAGGVLDPAKRARFLEDTEANARRFETGGLEAQAKRYRVAANRIQLENKDPRSFREFYQRFAGHSALGHANTLRGVQLRRPPLYALERDFARLKVPLLAFVGDEDESSLEPNLFIKSASPAARLMVVPATGHLVNVEEPGLFNAVTGDFLALVDSGRWRPRDSRSYNKSTMAKSR